MEQLYDALFLEPSPTYRSGAPAFSSERLGLQTLYPGSLDSKA